MIDVVNVTFGYSRKRMIFSDFSFTLESGRVYGLLGCNGVGKTTLLKLMTGLLHPKSGFVKVDDHEPMQRKPSFFQEIFFIPEEFGLPHLNLDEYVMAVAPFYPSFSREQLDYYVSEFSIDRQACLDTISMGESKRTYLAFALACQPKYLFLDEPTNGLDIPSASIFKSMLSSFISPENTVVVSTHHVADIQHLVDHVAIMDRDGLVLNESMERIGRLLKFGAIDDPGQALWSKETLLGRVGVSLNPEQTDNTPDLELLFNAVTNDKTQIINLFKQ